MDGRYAFSWYSGAQRVLRLQRLVGNLMKYLWVVLFVAAVAGLEFYHEFSGTDAPGALVCTAPQTAPEAVREFLLHHLQSHR